LELLMCVLWNTGSIPIRGEWHNFSTDLDLNLKKKFSYTASSLQASFHHYTQSPSKTSLYE
jgi:hypothetical protein